MNKIYNPYSTVHVIISFLNMYQEFDTYLGQRDYQDIKEKPRIEFFPVDFMDVLLRNFMFDSFWRIQIIAILWMKFQKKNLKI